VFSLADPPRSAVHDDERVARIVVAPLDYDLTIDELLTSRLTQIYASGLSVIRRGASEKEILAVVDRLLAADGVNGLVGAAVLDAVEIRRCGAPAKHFSVYDTEEPGIEYHADVAGTFDRALMAASRSGWTKEMKRRRSALRDVLTGRLLLADTRAALIDVLRAAGI
jgi:hypothetical protein